MLNPRRSPNPLLLCLLLTLPVGCGKEDALGVRRVAPESARGDATVDGRVLLTGTPPPVRPIDNQPCHDHAKPIEDETVLVGPSGGLRNVFVYLEGGPSVDGSTLLPAVLDQVDCRYVPHVVGVVAHQPLIVRSSDPAYHNTHYTPARNPAANFGLKQAGHQKTVSFPAPEIFHVRCDVHPWMSAYIGVFDNPLFAVTDADGAFAIGSVPSGDYTLVAWHELYGQQRYPIRVEGGAVTSRLIRFSVP
jgi:hypothetical protein